MNIEKITDYFLKEGFCIIPVKPGSKEPAVRWRKAEPAIRDEILRWTAQGYNLAVVCGSPSDGLVVVDCDMEEVYENLFDKSIENETLVVKTGLRADGTRGRHVFFKVASKVTTQHCAQKGLKLDLQSDGAIIVLPPSKHPSGVNYEFSNTSPPPIKRWNGDFEYEFIELIKNKLGFELQQKLIDTEELLHGVQHGTRDVAAVQLATFFRKQGLTSDKVFEKLQEWDKLNRDENGINPDPLGDEILWNKVNSAFTPEVPYNYRFKQKLIISEKVVSKESSGADLDDYIFEQVKDKYVVFNKKELKVIGLQDNFYNFRPLKPCLLLTPSNCTPFDDLGTLWSEIRQFICEHVDLREERDYDILTAWTVATWTPELWDAVPYVFFYGPAGSGKTWAMEVLKQLAFRGFLAASATPATLYYACQDWKPTLFLDEAEIYTRDAKAEAINILNSGYRKGQYAMRVGEPDRKTGVRQIVTFEVFGFKALAGTLEFVQTLKSRCLVINMSKAVRKIRSKIDAQKAETLRNKLIMYRFLKMTKKDIEPLPDDLRLDGRLRELFEPLIIVAPERERPKMIAIAEKMQTIQKEDEELSIEANVFRAIVRTYRSSGKEGKIAIQDVANALNAGLSLREQFEPTTVGYLSSRLGFRKVRYRNQRCIVWDEQLVERLSQRYPISDVEGVEEVGVSKPQTKTNWLLGDNTNN